MGDEKRFHTLLKCAAAPVAVAVACLVGLALFAPPAVVPDASGPNVFSAERAMRHVEAIASVPHPTGSAANDEVQGYLVAALKGLGALTEVQDATMVSARRGEAQAVRVHNVVGRFAGAGDAGAILLVSHYDSVSIAPGAGDSAAGVAALLEALRAITVGTPLRHDVIVLITDGEELGLLGAKAFVEEHRWAGDVAVVLNFDSRGSSGPSLMFETSDANRALIARFAGGAPTPIANSLMFEVYRLLPNDTDFSVFRRAGYRGLNFAFIDGSSNYHRPWDTPERLDRRSLQHHGDYALELTRQFGNELPEAEAGANAIYFNVAGSVFVRYPMWLAVALALALVGLFVWTVVRGRRSKTATVGGVLGGSLCLVASVVVSVVGVVILSNVLDALGASFLFQSRVGESAATCLSLGFTMVAIAIASASLQLVRKRVGATNLALGGLLLWVVLAVLATALLPGASFVFVWPALGAVVPAALLAAGFDPAEATVGKAALFAGCAVPASTLMAPLIFLSFVGLDLALWAIPIALAVLTFGLLAPIFGPLFDRAAWRSSLAALVVGGVLVGVGVATARADAVAQGLSSLRYCLDVDRGVAVFAAPRSDDGTVTVKRPTSSAASSGPGGILLVERFGLATTPTEVHAIPAPGVEVVSDATVDGVRSLKLRVASARRARAVTIYAESLSDVVAVSVDGKSVDLERVRANDGPTPIGQTPGAATLRLVGAPADGFIVKIERSSTDPLSLVVFDESDGLSPEIEAAAPAARLRAPYVSRSVLVQKRFLF